MSAPSSSSSQPFSAIFLSPHLDDAVLSATHALTTELAHPNARVLCLTIFTHIDPPPYSSDALSFCRDSGVTDPAQLFENRRTEDTTVMQQLGCEFQHWTHNDAGFRQDTQTQNPLYATFDQIFSGSIAAQDHQLTTQLVSELKNLQQKHTTPQTKWYAPLGVGNHADHLITYLAALQLMTTRVIPAQQLTFWLDVPYHHNAAAYFERLQTITLTSTATTKSTPSIAPQVHLLPWQHHWLNQTDTKLKQELTRQYTSQWAGLVDPAGYSSLDDEYERYVQLLPL